MKTWLLASGMYMNRDTAVILLLKNHCIRWSAGWKKKLDRLFTRTKLLITRLQVQDSKAIITNFHQPQSTLLLLVAAAVGDDWKKFTGTP